jgi:hypothetical protein
MRACAPCAVALVAALVGCAETRRSLGEACLKDDDCASGTCSGGQCVAPPPVLDAEPPALEAAAPTLDAEPDVTDANPAEGGG